MKLKDDLGLFTAKVSGVGLKDDIGLFKKSTLPPSGNLLPISQAAQAVEPTPPLTRTPTAFESFAMPAAKESLGFFTRPFGIEPFQAYSPMEMDLAREKHPVASAAGQIYGGVAPFLPFAPLFPAGAAGGAGLFGTVGGIREFGKQRVSGTGIKPGKLAGETAISAATGAFFGLAGKLAFGGADPRLTMRILSGGARAGTRGLAVSGIDAAVQKLKGEEVNLAQALVSGGIVAALSLMGEAKGLAKTALGRSIIKEINRAADEAGMAKGTITIDPARFDSATSQKSVAKLVQMLAQAKSLYGQNLGRTTLGAPQAPSQSGVLKPPATIPFAGMDIPSAKLTGPQAAAVSLGVPGPTYTHALPEALPTRQKGKLGPVRKVPIAEKVGEEEITQPPELEKALWDKMTPAQQKEYIEGQKVPLHPAPKGVVPREKGKVGKKSFREQAEDALIIPELDGGGDGLVVKVKSFGREGYVPLIEKYKGMDIVKTGDNFAVWNPKKETLFVVALDDSKTTGKRFINEKANNVESAKKYIDWITKVKSEVVTEGIGDYQHILRKGTDIDSLKNKSFTSGIGPNVLPRWSGKPTDAMQRKYQPREGDTILYIPKEWIKQTPNGPKIKEGFIPRDENIVKYQPEVGKGLIEHINKKDWWRTAENKEAVKERGQFFASSFKEAEFYGRPLDRPFKVNIKNPLIGDETTINKALGLEPPKGEPTVEERFALDKTMAQKAKIAGYDSIVLMTPKGYAEYKRTGKIPKSIELNDLTTKALKPEVAEPLIEQAKQAIPEVGKAPGKVTKVELGDIKEDGRLSIQPIISEGQEVGEIQFRLAKKDAFVQFINIVEGKRRQGLGKAAIQKFFEDNPNIEEILFSPTKESQPFWNQFETTKVETPLGEFSSLKASQFKADLTQPTPLLQQAKQAIAEGKSLEEFVAAQKQAFHGSPVKDIEEIGFGEGVRSNTFLGTTKKVKSGAIFFTPKKEVAQFFANNRTEFMKDLKQKGEATVYERFLNIKNPLDLTSIKKADDFFYKNDLTDDVADVLGVARIGGEGLEEIFEATGYGLEHLWQVFDNKSLTNKIKKLGYDGAILQEAEERGTSYAIFNPKQAFTKSQLTDIWKEAQKKPTQAKFKKIPVKKAIATGQITHETNIKNIKNVIKKGIGEDDPFFGWPGHQFAAAWIDKDVSAIIHITVPKHLREFITKGMASDEVAFGDTIKPGWIDRIIEAKTGNTIYEKGKGFIKIPKPKKIVATKPPKLKAPPKAKPQPLPKGKFVYPEKKPVYKFKTKRAPGFELVPSKEAPKPKPQVTLPPGVTAKAVPSGAGDVMSTRENTNFKERDKHLANMPFALAGNKAEVLSRLSDATKKLITQGISKVYDLWGGAKGYRVGLFTNVKPENYNLNEWSPERYNYYKNMQDVAKAQEIKTKVEEIHKDLFRKIGEVIKMPPENYAADDFLMAVNSWAKKSPERMDKIKASIQVYGRKLMAEASADGFKSTDSSAKYYFLENSAARGVQSDAQGNYTWSQGIIKSKGEGVKSVKDVALKIKNAQEQLGKELIRDSGMPLTNEDAWQVMDRLTKDLKATGVEGKAVMVDPQYLDPSGSTATYSVGAGDTTWAGHKANLEKHFLPLVQTGVKIVYTNNANPELLKWLRDNKLPYNIEKEIGKTGITGGRDETISFINYRFPKQEYVAPSRIGPERKVEQPKPGGAKPVAGGEGIGRIEGKGPSAPRVKPAVFESDIEKKVDRLVRAKNLTPNQMNRLRRLYHDFTGEQFVEALANITPSTRPGKPPSIPRTTTITTKGFFDAKFKEPTPVRWLTPMDAYIRALGLQSILGPAMEAKTKMLLERTRLYKSVDILERNFTKFAKPGFKAKFKAAVRATSTPQEEKLWDYLHVAKDKVADVVPAEWRPYHDAIREITDWALKGANQIRVAHGEEPIRYIDGYIMHIKNAFEDARLKGKYPLPPDVAYWLDKIHTKRIFNPTAQARTKFTEEGLLKKPFVALKAMIAADLKQIYLTAPNLLFKQKIEALSKAGLIPNSTRLYAEAFMNTVIKGYPSGLDQLIDRGLDALKVPEFMNFALRPFGRTWGRSSVVEITRGLGRAIHDSVIWGKIKLVLRNHTQKNLLLGLYPSRHFISGFMPENPELRRMIDTSDFYKISKSTFMEQLPKGSLAKLEQWGFAPYGHSHAGRIGGNVPFAMKVAYSAARYMVDSPKMAKYGWTESDIIKEMEFGANTTQYWYNLMGMPEIYRHKTLGIFAKLQSWFMNYTFKYWREMLSRAFTGRTGWGKPIPPSWRWGAVRHIIASVLFIEGMRRAFGLSYERTALLGVLPAYLSPPGQIAVGLWKLMTATSEWERKKAINMLKYSWKAFIPGSGAWRDIAGVWTGKKPLKSLFFHTTKEKKKSGGKLTGGGFSGSFK